MRKMHNYLNVICLVYCLVINWIIKEPQELWEKNESENLVCMPSASPVKPVYKPHPHLRPGSTAQLSPTRQS